MKFEVRALVYLLDPKTNKVLLAQKRQAEPFKGMYNAYGGKLKDYKESPEQAALRELYEESGIKGVPESLHLIAKIYAEFPEFDADGVTFAYVLTQWEGTPTNTKEMLNATWFDINKLPLDNMWESDRYWLPLALKNYVMATQKLVHAHFIIDKSFKVKGVEIRIR